MAPQLWVQEVVLGRGLEGQGALGEVDGVVFVHGSGGPGGQRRRQLSDQPPLGASKSPRPAPPGMAPCDIRRDSFPDRPQSGVPCSPGQVEALFRVILRGQNRARKVRRSCGAFRGYFGVGEVSKVG